MRSVAAFAFAVALVVVAAAQPPQRREEEDTKPAPKAIPSFPDAKAKADPTQGTGEPPGPGVVVVGVRHLPEKMSPARARTEAERWSLDLLFEGLLRATPSEAGTVFEPALADAPARGTPDGRSFSIDAATRWHDDSPVLANDVIASLGRWHAVGRYVEWGESASDSPRQLRLTLRAPHPDPSALCTFRVTPAKSRDDDAFAAKPVGSGPFHFAGAEKKKGRSYAVFKAFPGYGQRKDRLHRPVLREVWFLEGPDPIADFRKGLSDVVVEERSSLVLPPIGPGAAAKPEENFALDARIETRPTRRIYYLGFNTLKITTLGGDGGVKLRRAIALGVNREAILDALWRQRGQSTHKALTGPFPAASWPADPDSPSLDDPTLAAAELRASPQKADKLTLVFDHADPLTEAACGLIRDQLRAIGLSVELKPLSADAFARALADKDYDLAYRRYEFRDDWFDPRGLFAVDAGGLGGEGSGAARLEAALARCAANAEFTRLRDARRRLHREFREQMPFVPLWCPDAHVIVRRAVEIPQVARIDPDAPLRHADLWKADRR